MRLKNLMHAGAIALIATALVACDGSENPRTLPTGGPDYISPAGNPVGPQGAGESHGEGESHDEGGAEGEGEAETEGEGEGEESPTAAP
ncbi:MAG: hypothetical protein H7Z42_18475 [Roseiflexaceae bacterium]|nr:hypothetical protein [Roseiflexaceae bacterium]